MAPDQTKRVAEGAKNAQRVIYDKQRLERIATAAMQGMLASGGSWRNWDDLANDAAHVAHAMIARLDKE